MTSSSPSRQYEHAVFAGAFGGERPFVGAFEEIIPVGGVPGKSGDAHSEGGATFARTGVV
jgi:hypothetical protein